MSDLWQYTLSMNCYLSLLNTLCLIYVNIICIWLATYLYWILHVWSMKIYFFYDLLPISTEYSMSDLWKYIFSMTCYLSLLITPCLIYDNILCLWLSTYSEYSMSNLWPYTLSMTCYLSLLITPCLIFYIILCLWLATYLYWLQHV